MIKRMLLIVAVLTVAAGAATGLAAQVRFGVQLDWGDDTDLGLGARLEHPWRLGGAPLNGAGHFDYFFVDEGGVFGANVTYFEINYNVYYQFRAQALTPYAGGGLGLRYLSVDVAGESRSDTELGLNLGGGLRFRTAGRLAPFIEGRFTLGGNVEQFIITGGLLF